jgi:hypothetical protein
MDYHQIFKNTLDRFAEDQFKGYNPYDILDSDVIYKHVRNKNAILALTQFNKISPINFRKQFGIRKHHNPKALGLLLSALLKTDAVYYKSEISDLKKILLENKSDKFENYSIGFPFPICLSHYTSVVNSPSLIITLFVAYSFIEDYHISGDERVLKTIESINNLIQSKLPKVENEDILYYSYNFEKFNEIYNATAKIGKFYSLYYTITKDEILLSKIKKILNYLCNIQRSDGSWAYAPYIHYSDSFHTAFIIEAIAEMMKLVSSVKYEEMFEKGMKNYRDSYILPSGQPLYIHPQYGNKGRRKLLEVTKTDIRDCAMAINLFTKCGLENEATKCLDWTIQNMYSSKGYFYFYKEKMWTNKIEHARPQGWMLYALSNLF